MTVRPEVGNWVVSQSHDYHGVLDNVNANIWERKMKKAYGGQR